MIQAAAGFACVALPGAALWPLAVGLASNIPVAIAAVWWSSRRRVRDSREHSAQLAHWLHDLDLDNRSYAPANAPRTESNTQLIDAVEDLAQRVRGYREKLLKRHQRVQRLLRNVTDVLYQTDAGGRLTWVTDQVSEILGYRPRDMINVSLKRFLADPERDFALLVESTRLAGQPVRALCKNGEIAWLMVSSRRVDGPAGVRDGTEGIWRDGTRLMETQCALDREKERAQVTLAAIGDGVITTDAGGQVDYLNPRAASMLGVRYADALGRDFDQLCRLVDTEHDERLTGIVDACVDTGATRRWEDAIVLCNGHDLSFRPAVKLTISPIRGSDTTVVGTVVAMSDITRLQQIRQEMSYQANHDLVTGLPNRRAFEAELAQVQTHPSEAGMQHALFYMDLDQFKLVNDTCGHDAGDEMLRRIADLLGKMLRSNDTFARLGGDEFGTIIRNIDNGSALGKAEQLRAEIDRFRFRWHDKLFQLGVSIGLTWIDDRKAGVTELLRRADTACYAAKEKGRNQVCVYQGRCDEAQTGTGDMQRMQQIGDFLENNRLALFAQIIQPLTHTVGDAVGVELLLRVCNPDGTYLAPQNFLIAAERYHAAPRIDRWVLAEALTLIEAAEHHRGQVEHYSINLSAQSISDSHFVDFALEQIGSAHVDPKKLVFEITETAAVSNTLRASALIGSLRALGCRFSLDDFGSGLSSFANLKELPSDFVKIDGKLVRNILSDRVEASIVQGINQIGHAMGLLTVAEHVENQAVVDALRDIGVDYVQGFHVAHPVAFEQLDELLGDRGSRRPVLVRNADP